MNARRPHGAHFLNVFNPVFIGRQLAMAWGFVRSPTAQPPTAVGMYRGIVAALALLIGLKLVQVLVIVVRVYSQDYGLMPVLTNAVERETLHWPWWQMLLAAGLIGPLLEELAFRAHLRFGRVLAALSITAATYYILTQSVYGLRTHDLETAVLVRVGGALGAGIVSFAVLKALPALEAALVAFWTRQFRWIFWGVALVFGLVHLGRYELHWEHLPFVPLIILPQVLSALIYGVARMRYGLVYAIGMHMFANSLGSLLASLNGN